MLCRRSQGSDNLSLRKAGEAAPRYSRKRFRGGVGPLAKSLDEAQEAGKDSRRRAKRSVLGLEQERKMTEVERHVKEEGEMVEGTRVSA